MSDKPLTDATFAVGGREFRLIREGTLKHDNWVERLFLRTGIRLALLRQEGESDQDFNLRITLDAALHPDMSLVLGGLLVPVETTDVEWTEDMANETAEFLGNLTDERDQNIVRSIVASLVVDFQSGGHGPSKPTPRSGEGMSATSSEPAG